MPIWKLEPVDLNSEHWATSTHRGAAIVRAANEQRARAVATSAFIIEAPVLASRKTLYTPWAQPELVRCSCHEGSDFAESGPEAVLVPPHHEPR